MPAADDPTTTRCPSKSLRAPASARRRRPAGRASGRRRRRPGRLGPAQTSQRTTRSRAGIGPDAERAHHQAHRAADAALLVERRRARRRGRGDSAPLLQVKTQSGSSHCSQRSASTPSRRAHDRHAPARRRASRRAPRPATAAARVDDRAGDLAAAAGEAALAFEDEARACHSSGGRAWLRALGLAAARGPRARAASRSPPACARGARVPA